MRIRNPLHRSVVYAAITVTAFAAAASIILLPALMELFGHRIDALDLRKGVRRILGCPRPAVDGRLELVGVRTAA